MNRHHFFGIAKSFLFNTEKNKSQETKKRNGTKPDRGEAKDFLVSLSLAHGVVFASEQFRTTYNFFLLHKRPKLERNSNGIDK
jgi:hypothetical protein